MIKKISFAICLLTGASLFAQNYVHRVLVLNEGYYDFANQQQVVPVSLGSYDPVMNSYTEVASISGVRFASDVKVGNNAVFVAADSLLIKYDKDSYQFLGQTTVVGIRKIALWNNQVLISKGEIGGLTHYFEVRSASDLSLLYSVDPSDGLSWSCEDIHVENNTAYLAIGNAFDWANLVGKVGMVDLVNETFTGSIDLGPNGLNPENIMVKNGQLYTLNNKDFSASSVSHIDMANNLLSGTQDITLNSGCGASVMADGHIYYQEYNIAKLARYDYSASVVIDTLVNTSSYYGLIHDELNGWLYATTTDFVTTGELRQLAYDGTVLNTALIGVSAGNLALDIRSATGIQSVIDGQLNIVYDRLGNRLILPSGTFDLYNLSGQRIWSEVNSGRAYYSTANLPAGVYAVAMNGTVFRFVK